MWVCIKTVVVLLVLYGCNREAHPNRLVYIKEFGWSFQIQKDTKFKDSSFDLKGNIIQGYQKVGFQEIISLFTIQEGINERFSSMAIKDSLDIESWKAKCDADHKWYFGQISLNQNVKIIDTMYSDEKLDGLNFKKEFIKLYDQRINDTVWNYHYFGKFKLYELSINFLYTNKDIGRKYFEILHSSKFR